MLVTLTFVSSVNSKVTKGEDPDVRKWASKEDQELFAQISKEYKVIITGRKAYEAFKLKGVDDGKQRIVFTRDLLKYKSQEKPGEIEFTNESPINLIKRLEKGGVDKILLSSGPTIATLFFEQGLIDNFILTIEPKLFGTGAEFIIKSNVDVNLKLTKTQKLNDQGTLVLYYKIIK